MWLTSRAFTLSMAALALGLPLPSPPARAADAKADAGLNGLWKLSVLSQLTEDELFVVQIRDHAGETQAEFTDSRLPAPPRVVSVSANPGAVRLTFKMGEIEATFSGKPTDASTVLGMLKVGERSFPSRLERTDARTLHDPPVGANDLVRAYGNARNEPLPKTRVRLIRALLARKPGDPSLALLYDDVLRNADAAELPEAEVRKIADAWIAGAKPFGDDYANQIRVRALLALEGSEPHAAYAVELARETEAALGPKAPLQDRARVVGALADAARLAGNETLAKESRARSDRLESELDAEYRKHVPPFTPRESAGPRDRSSRRVVLLELFTGAECPPCVAADVAFDALNVSYKPSRLVTLQYHVHIPGSDPLTNPDNVQRLEFYPDFRGTPSLYLDGAPLDLPGGRMSDAEDRYDSYSRAVDAELVKPSRATLALKVDRAGETLKIRASAEVKDGGPSLKLRLALIEDQVRYPGGNGVRYHHHVVRALPGGVKGHALDDGKGEVVASVDLARLRADLSKYLEDYARDEHRFAHPLPPLALAKLAVVAFVQDDDDRSVLNAALVPVRAGD